MALKNVTKIVGWFFLAVGILGFIPAFRSDVVVMDDGLRVHAAHGLLFGIFPVNAVHNIIHIAFGIWGITAGSAAASSLSYCRATSVICAVMAFMGVLPVLSTFFGLAPLHGANVALHVSIALVTGYFGFVYAKRPAFRDLSQAHADVGVSDLSHLPGSTPRDAYDRVPGSRLP